MDSSEQERERLLGKAVLEPLAEPQVKFWRLDYPLPHQDTQNRLWGVEKAWLLNGGDRVASLPPDTGPFQGSGHPLVEA